MKRKMDWSKDVEAAGVENPILDVQTNVLFDESISRIQNRVHLPYVTNAYANNDEIRITIQQEESRVYIHESYLYVEGKISKGLLATVPKDYKLVQNAFSHLFEEVRFELNNQVIDQVRNVGMSSTMKSYVMCNLSEAKTMFYHHEIQINADGTFCVSFPLKLFLGFVEFYKKIIINAKHELILLRAKNDQNLFVSEVQPKLELTKIQWHVPHVTVNLRQRLKLLKVIDTRMDIQVPFRSYELHECPIQPISRKQSWTIRSAQQMEKPRYVLVGFQKDRKKINADASQFDHCNIRDVKLFLNTESYPYTSFNADFDRNMYELMYNSYVSMRPACTGKPIDPLFDRKQFKEIAPLIAIDCSKQNDTVQPSTVDIKLEMESDEPFSENTVVYCLIIHDRVIEYNPATTLVKILR